MNFTKYVVTSIFTILCLFLSLVSAAPVEIRDVFVPPILYPHTGTVWYVGQRHNVTWDVSNPPKQITNRFGTILVRKDNRTVPNVTLAEGFDILLGRIEITVPDITGDAIQLILMGDSGNWSDNFTIAA